MGAMSPLYSSLNAWKTFTSSYMSDSSMSLPPGMPSVLEIISVLLWTRLYSVSRVSISAGGRKLRTWMWPRDFFADGLSLTSSRLDRRVHATVDATDALHETDRVPVDVVVDEQGAVLEVHALAQDVGGDEDAQRRELLAVLGRHLVVEGREALDHRVAVVAAACRRSGRRRPGRPRRAAPRGSGRCRRTR